MANWTTPRLLEFEWFASTLDLCNVLASSGARGQLIPSSELLKILSINPGVQFDRSRWSYIGYKGGSEPGVLNLSWLLQRADGRWFSVVVTLNDRTKAIDEHVAVQLAAGVVAILAEEP